MGRSGFRLLNRISHIQNALTASQRPYKIVFIAGTLGKGGAEKQLYLWCKILTRSGHSVRVLALTRGEYYDLLLKDIGIIPEYIGRLAYPLARILKLATLRMGNWKPDAIISSHTYANIYAAILGILSRTPSIGALRSSYSHTLRGNGKWTHFLLRCNSRLVVNSEAAITELISNHIRKNRDCTYIPNAIESVSFRFAKKRPLEKVLPGEGLLKVLWVGRIISVKRLDRFLKALSLLTASHFFHALIVGDGPETQIHQTKANLMGLGPDRLSFLGARIDIPEIMASADLFVLTSEDEGSPNVVLEAMAAGLPIISSPAGEASILVRDGWNGYLVENGDPELFSKAIARLLVDQEKRLQMGEVGRRYVEDFHSLEASEPRLKNLIQSCRDRR